ncbi:hypothetical protein [Nocardia asteroides]|uniref:hypothetical protein n=1 Tax=Nocardia asteroides TaxID=1824 RepID=UPI001E50F080|nr:hypothetical protein [Nocardia asteroides]UGT54825.1 hypothetical protein LTT85_30185 [Nocardia asteroides]
MRKRVSDHRDSTATEIGVLHGTVIIGPGKAVGEIFGSDISPVRAGERVASAIVHPVIFRCCWIVRVASPQSRAA